MGEFKMYRSSGLSRSFFPEEPPYYEHELLASVEEIATNTSKEIDFSKVMDGLEKSSEGIISSISDEGERSRVQAKIDAEKIQDGISQTNYELMNVSFGIDRLEDTFRQSSNEVIAQIRESGLDVVKNIKITNQKLTSIDNNLLTINNTLQNIGGVLSVILERINKPNETQAIELADNARANLAIGDYDDALRVTKKAMEVCSTSITAMGYHLMTLSLFDDKKLRKELKVTYGKFVKLVDFKLTDTQYDIEVIGDELFYVVYPTISALSKSLGGNVLSETQSLYTSISNNRNVATRLLTKPILDSATQEMISHPSPIRELSWTVILKEVSLNNDSFKFMPKYVSGLARSEVLIKNELLYLANKELYQNGLLINLLNKQWQENKATEEELDCMDAFLAMQPQDNIVLDDKSLLLIDRYVDKCEIPINSSLREFL